MRTSEPGNRSTITYLCLAGAVLFWGTSFMATKVALRDFPPMTVIWLRMAFASLAMLPLWPRVPKPKYAKGDWKWLALLVGLHPCLYFAFEGYAVGYTTSSQAGVVSAIVPLLVAAGAWAFLRERLSAQAGVAIAISLAGVAMLSLGGTAHGHAPNPALGNALELFAMVCGAGYMLVVRHLGSRYNAWLLAGVQALAGAVFFLPAAIASGPASWTHASPAAWVSVVSLGTLSSLGAVGLYNTAAARLPASRAALSINLVPLVAVVAGWLVLGESLAPLQLIACAVIIGAVVLGETASQRSVVPEVALGET